MVVRRFDVRPRSAGPLFIQEPHEAGLKIRLRDIKMSPVRKREEMNAISFVLQLSLIASADAQLGIGIRSMP
jgi:hypothetical protein